MTQRLSLAFSAAAFVLALLGVTPLGQAAGSAASDAVAVVAGQAKGPLQAVGIIKRGPRGLRGPRGFKGLAGAKGATGAVASADASVMARLANLVASGKVKAAIDTVVPLDETPAAIEQFVAGKRARSSSRSQTGADPPMSRSRAH
jgi:NADPH:quinone reductase-like Zn-dependent oxidoreductase